MQDVCIVKDIVSERKNLEIHTHFGVTVSQAAGALFPKIGNKPIDLLSPVALNNLKHVFSIKDTIGKKEAWDISTRFGITVSQVREFFSFQQSRVRKLAKLSGEKASAPCDALHDKNASTSDSHMTADPVPSGATVPTHIVEGLPCSVQHGVLDVMTEPDKTFIGNIFSEMRKEKSFSGQVELLERIMQEKNVAVQNWFVNEGGVMILTSWLSDAVMEEQTSVIDSILKALFSLPLENATPELMSSLLPSVDSLQFYRSSVISNSARTLLDRCQKKSSGNQSLETSSKDKSVNDTQDEMVLKQSIHKFMSFTSGDEGLYDDEEIMEPFYEIAENCRKLDAPCPQKISVASEDISNKMQGILLSGTQEYQEVKKAKHPDQSLPRRSPKVAKSSLITRSPTDEVQKAKMGSRIMQDKFEKLSICLDDQGKSKSRKRSTSSQANDPPYVPKHNTQVEVVKCQKIDNAFSRTVKPHETSCLNLEPPRKKYGRIQIPWRMPPGTQEYQDVKKAKHPDQSLPGRSSKVAKFSLVAQSPADELQKANIGSQIMQDTFEKLSICLDDQRKSKSRKRSTSSQTNDPPYVPKHNPQLEVEKCQKIDNTFSRTVNPHETSCLNLEPPGKMYERIQIPWRMPPELKIRSAWFVDSGSNSNEVNIQQNRLQLEKETIYKTIEDIPPDPREPWEFEVDYEDMSTPEIPIIPLSTDVQPPFTLLESENGGKNNVVPIVSASFGHTSKPDFELPAKLLKIPEMVFGSTSGHASCVETANLPVVIQSKGEPEATASQEHPS